MKMHIKTMTIIGAAFAVCCAAVAAMPTQEELDKADALVQEVMKAEMDALRSGKKTREQVADAAVALAKQAQTPAEKYLLLTGAFDQYARGGSYEKANGALVALRTAIPDWKLSDELALIEKPLRSIAYGKGGPVRERYEALKERQQYALRLKKALSQVQSKPSDKKLQFQVATYFAALDRWPQAVEAFLSANNPACADAAKLEKESAPPAKIADAWWSASNLKPDFLSSAIRAHAVDLYKKALADPSFAGLQRVAAEKRIAEFESVLAASESSDTTVKSSASSSSSVGMAKYYGVELIGGSVKESQGVLCGFAIGSYAKIKAPFQPQNETIETVIEFSTGGSVDSDAGILCSMTQHGFAPLFILKGQLLGFLSSNGSSWNLANELPLGLGLKPKTKYRVKVVWDGRLYAWFLWEKGSWRKLKDIANATPVCGGINIHFGVNRGLKAPFSGEVDLNKCYICVGGKLWWEGVRGAYKNANK